MAKDELHLFRKYLPENCEVQIEPMGSSFLAILKNEKKLSFGCHSDSRLALFQAVGHYLAQRLPQQLGLDPNALWVYGVQSDSARLQSILKAISYWAFNQWLNKNLVPQVMDLPSRREEQLRLFLPRAKQVCVYTVPLSLFERETGIMHVRFLTVEVQTDQGDSLLSGTVSLNNETALEHEAQWIRVLSQLWWQQCLLQGEVQNPDPAQLQRLKTLQAVAPVAQNKAAFVAWPALRLRQIHGEDLKILADLPGYLWSAEVEDEQKLVENKWLL